VGLTRNNLLAQSIYHYSLYYRSFKAPTTSKQHEHSYKSTRCISCWFFISLVDCVTIYSTSFNHYRVHVIFFTWTAQYNEPPFGVMTLLVSWHKFIKLGFVQTRNCCLLCGSYWTKMFTAQIFIIKWMPFSSKDNLQCLQSAKWHCYKSDFLNSF